MTEPLSLFAQTEKNNLDGAKPLAARMRPTTLDQFVGQKHFLGEGELLWRLVKADRLGSVIFFGPPGTGKTTLARILAHETKKNFVQLSAIQSGVADLRRVLAEARNELAEGGVQTLLFIDEIHRFNKSQQDALLPDVEDGIVVLLGATTSNPFFAVNNALVSRSRVFQFEPLSTSDILELLQRALEDKTHGLGRIEINVEPDSLEFLSKVCDGDARQALSTLETAVLSSFEKPVKLTRQLIEDSIQKRAVQYDASGDEHYDCASALIKSIRGSDPDAGLYWLARMLEGGEDIRFLCRRLVILASEDVGNADPQALPLAVACMQACEFVGLPECQLTLSQTVSYLACAPKSNASTTAIGEAISDIRHGRILPVPRSLRDSHYSGAQDLDHGQGYKYAHNAPGGVSSMDYLGVDREYYQPVDRGFEAELQMRLKEIRSRLREAKQSDPENDT